jgi:hypothetical protein
MQIEKVCQICGKTFKVPHWRENAKYCSRECSDKSRIAKTNLVCAVCGKPFHRKPYHLKRYKGEFGFCCSKSCSAILRVEMMSGENNHQYGLKGCLNSSFKHSELTHKNNKFNDVMIYVGDWYAKSNSRGRITKHRYLIELNHSLFDEAFFEKIGDWFYLKNGLEVHHKDLNHNNNELNNLEVLTKSQHRKLHNKLHNQKRNKKGQFTKVE